MKPSDQNEFQDLQKLLALKNYEQPKAGFYEEVLREHRLTRETRGLSISERAVRRARRAIEAEGAWTALGGVGVAALVCLGAVFVSQPTSPQGQMVASASGEGDAPLVLAKMDEIEVPVYAAQPMLVVDFRKDSVASNLGLASEGSRREF